MILQKGRYDMLKESIKGYKELKAERSQFKQKALEIIDKILDDVYAANIEDCFEIRTELETVHLMCNISDNTISIIISINTKLDLALIELTKEEIIKGMSVIDFKDAVKKINQFISQNSPKTEAQFIDGPTEETIKNIRTKINYYYDNVKLDICHKNILMQTIDDLITAESIKTDLLKEEIVNSLKTKIHNHMIKIDDLELKLISQEKELRTYALFLNNEIEVTQLIDILNHQNEITNLIMQYKEDQLKISRMKVYNKRVHSIEILKGLVDDANSRFEEIENEIDELYNKLMK